MANHMSNPMKKPYTQGKKISSQGQNELSTQQANEDPSRAVLRLWPGSTFCTPTNLTGIPAMPEKGVPVSSSLPVCDKLETTGTFLAKGSKSTLSICAREETQQPVGHASFFTSTHSHILSSLTTGMTTNPVSSTFQGHKQISVGSDSSSFNCWPNNENASEFSSKFPLNSSDDGPSVEQLVATDLNPQLAVNILMNYGLGEEDLDELLSYPEDQTTAENLPNTLHELRMKKIRRASASPKSYPGVSSQPTFVMDKVGRLDEIPQNSHRPSKVVDPGHSGKCFSEVEDKTDETICQTDKSDKNMLLIDGLKSSGNNNEVPQKRLTEVESSSEMSNIVATPSSNPTKPQTSPNQTSQKVITILSSSDKYKDMLEPRPEVLKSVPSEEPVHHAPSKTVPASSPGQSVNSGHSGVLQVISKDKSFVKSQTKTQQGSNMTEPGNQPIQQKMVQKPSALQIWEALQPAFPFNVKPVPKSFSFPSPSVASHSIQPPVFIGNDPGPSIIYSSQPVSDLSSTSMSRSRQPFLAKNPTFEGLPPLAMMHDFAAVPPRIFPHTCSLCMEECEQMKDWMIHQNTNLHLENCKRFRERYPEWDGELPRFPSALSRSAETPPPTSAHISQHHQKAGHESSCSRSHSPYSSGNRYRKSRSSSSSCSSGYRQHRSRDRRVKSCSSGSRSCSRSPRRRRSRERRAKPHSSISRSCSRSPRRCSSRERRPKPRSSISRSCSRSPRRCSSRERRPKPRSSSSRSRSHSPQRRSPRNRRDKSSSNSRSSSPHRQYRTEGQKGKYGKGPRSPHRAIYRIRSRSASPERQSSPRRTYRKLQHPETLKPRNYKRPSPTSFKQQLSSRRDEEKHLQPKKSDEDSASFKGSRKRRMSLEESSSNKKKLPGIKKLTDLLLENPVVQSLSGKPDIKDVVERMVPFVLAELANNTTSSSLPSSSSSVPSQDKKRNASPSSYGGSNSSFSSKISKKHPTIQKSERSSSSKSKTVAYDKPSPPTIVKLKGVFDLLSHNDVVAAVKPFGKTKSVLLLKSKQEACYGNSDQMEPGPPGKIIQEADVHIPTSPDVQELFEGGHEDSLVTMNPVKVAEDVADLEKSCQEDVADLEKSCQEDEADLEKSCQEDEADLEKSCQEDVADLEKSCQEDEADLEKSCQEDVADLEKSCQEDVADLEKSCQAEEAVSVMSTVSNQDPNPDETYIIPMISHDKAQADSPVQRTSKGELKWKIKFHGGSYYIGQSKPLDCYQFMNMLCVKDGWFDPEIKVSTGTAPLLEMKNNPLVFSASFPPNMLGRLPSREHQVTDLSLFYLGEDVLEDRKKFRGYATTHKGTLSMPIADDGIMLRRRVDVEATVQAMRMQPDLEKLDMRFLRACVFALKYYGPLLHFNSQRGCCKPPHARTTGGNKGGHNRRGHKGRGHKGSKDKWEPADASGIEAGENEKWTN